MPEIGKTLPMKFGAILCALAAVSVGVPAASAQEVPHVLVERSVIWPHEVSGVAAVDEGFLVVGDETPFHFFNWPGGDAHRLWRKDGGRVRDAESIDVGYGPNGQRLYVVLSEDSAEVYVRGAPTIELDQKFKETCGRGAEGLSVRWDGDGWDLVVLLEGGIYGRKGTYGGDSSCPPDEDPHNARVARYHLKPDGTRDDRPVETHKLRTTDLLKGIDDNQAFRATDIAWYKEKWLVLLGSTEIGKHGGGPYTHTWIQGYDPDDRNPIDGWRIILEPGPAIWKGKNWEALDTTLDGHRLVLGYDNDGPSEIVVIDPDFN